MRDQLKDGDKKASPRVGKRNIMEALEKKTALGGVNESAGLITDPGGTILQV